MILETQWDKSSTLVKVRIKSIIFENIHEVKRPSSWSPWRLFLHRTRPWSSSDVYYNRAVQWCCNFCEWILFCYIGQRSKYGVSEHVTDPFNRLSRFRHLPDMLLKNTKLANTDISHWTLTAWEMIFFLLLSSVWMQSSFICASTTQYSEKQVVIMFFVWVLKMSSGFSQPEESKPSVVWWYCSR